MPIMDMLPKGDTLQIPLDAPTSLAATAGNAQVELTWTDPLDKYATPEGDISDTGDQLVSEWDHTVLVRKTGSQPTGPNDGTVVVSSSVRNQYQTTPYTDTGLTNDTEYFYGVFAYNKDGVASPGAFVSATPKAGTPLSSLTEGTIIKINENGSPVEFYLAKHNYEPTLNGEGRELVVRKDVWAAQTWNNTNYNTYASSAVNGRLNSTYKGYFSSAVQAMIGSTKFYYTPGNGDGSLGQLERPVFLLSSTELGKTPSNGRFNAEGSILPIANTLAIVSLNGEAYTQWTRTPNNDSANAVVWVNDQGYPALAYATDNNGVRPAFTLPSTALVSPQLELVED